MKHTILSIVAALLLAMIENLPQDQLKQFLASYGLIKGAMATELKPELIRILQQVPSDDLKDFLALHGVGTFGRQLRAHMSRDIARNWASIVIITIFPALAAIIIVLCTIYGHG